jgi:hypothetical protein
MKRKAKAGPDRAEPSAATIARLAGVSIPLVYRKLQEGKTGAEIIAASQRRKEESVLRDLPPVKVDANGHAAGALSYAGAQAEKERWAAALRKLEFQERTGEVVPVSYIRHWGANFLIAAKDEMLKMPGELQDVLAAESDPLKVAAILRLWVERVMDKYYRLDRLWGLEPKDDVA